MPLHWPDHNYLGPGTDLSKKLPPVDLDDEIAREHDEAYSLAKSFQDVQDADLHAIKDYAQAIVVNPDTAIHLGVAASVLTAKYTIEKILGRSFYPRMTRPEKRPALDTSVMETEQEEKKENDSGESAVPTNPIQICRSSEGLAFGKAVIFKKSWILTTWGFQTGAAIKRDDDTYLLRTPLASIPVDCLPIYMSPGEFYMLPHGASAKKCFVKVTGKGIRMPFETASAYSVPANSESLVFGLSAKELNHKFNLQIHKYIATAQDPTVVEKSEFRGQDWSEFFYNDFTKASACMPWIHKRLTHYCTVNLGKTHSNYNIPTFMNEINMFDIRTAQGEPVINYEYEFDVAPLRDKYTLTLSDHNTWYTGMRNVSFQKVDVNENNNLMQSQINGLRANHFYNANHLRYNDRIEKKDFTSYGTTPVTNLLCQPDLYVGVIPPLASSPFDATPKFQQVMAYWQVDATLVVDFNMYSAGIGMPCHKVTKNTYVIKDVKDDHRKAASQDSYVDGHHGYEK